MENLGEQDRIHALIRDSPSWWRSPALRRLYFFMLPPLMTSTALGFDIAMTNGLQSVEHFMNFFGNPSGAELGFYGAAMSVGGILGSIVGGPLVDRFGRKILCFVGAALVVGMAIMQSFSTSFAMFNGGKLVLGFGIAIEQVASPVLVTELAHPKQRVTVTSIYNTGIYIGMLIGAWITFGTYSMDSSWSWRIPCLLQAALPAYQLVMIWLCPESPRWLISKGRLDEARDILVKYHGDGEENEIVRAEVQEIIAGIEADQTMLKFNKEGLKTVLGSKGNRHRLWITFWCAVGSQCLGNGLVSTYLPLILDQVGLASSAEKTLINAMLNTWNLLVAVPAALVIYRFSRRGIFLVSTAGVIVVFSIWTALAAEYVKTQRGGLGIGVVASIFVFNGFYSICWVPMVISYPLELSTTKQRGIFFSFELFVINASSFVINYINPVALDALSWRYYIIQCVFNAVVFGVVWFTFVETKGLTLEEIAGVFDGSEAFENAVAAVEADMRKAEGKVGHVEVTGDGEHESAKA